MNIWNVITTDEFIAALEKLPDTPVVQDVIAELLDRLETNAGEGEKVPNSECWIIRSVNPGIRISYRLDAKERNAYACDVWLIEETTKP